MLSHYLKYWTHPCVVVSGIQGSIYSLHNKFFFFNVVTVFYFGFSFSEPNKIILVSALVKL